jgi:AraC-like DNA-binding protein
MNNIDFIINLSTPIRYISKVKDETLNNSHFIGIQDNHLFVEQKGKIDIVGISFTPIGFYPLIKEPLSKFANRIMIIDQIIPAFKNIEKKMAGIESNQQRIYLLEELLLNTIDFNLLPDKNYDTLIKDFLTYGDTLIIKDYCINHFYNQKSIERFFKKYVGITPKAFLINTKFQKSIKSLRNCNFDSLAEIGYEYNYYDQTHFINSFKSYMGMTPAKQLKANNLIMDILPKK